MATVYSLNASACPVPVVPSALLSIAGEVPTTWTPLVAASSGSGSLVSKANKNAVRGDVLGRAGAGAIAIDWDSGSSSSTPGLELTVSSGLTIQCGTGQAMIDGPVQVTTPLTTALTNNTTCYIYLTQAGALSVVNASTTPPAGLVCYLGRATTAAGAITAIDGSGVMFYKGSMLVRRTADTTTPTDTPPSGLAFITRGPDDSWLWDGDRYLPFNLSGGYRSTLDGWWADNVPGTAGPTQMTRFGAGAAFPNVWIAPRAGSVTGVVVKSNAARTAGTLTVEVYKNGAGTGLTAVLDGTNTTVKATTQAMDLDAFVAGDELDVRVTTAGWTPTTADIRAAIEIES